MPALRSNLSPTWTLDPFAPRPLLRRFAVSTFRLLFPNLRQSAQSAVSLLPPCEKCKKLQTVCAILRARTLFLRFFVGVLFSRNSRCGGLISAHPNNKQMHRLIVGATSVLRRTKTISGRCPALVNLRGDRRELRDFV